ncbi:bifunctional diguanylate cyclase/phosphodiesterase [Aeromicrobium fastidiosum]|uniref:putative bifunctional diguanylate cyclase/phosphodiesterase n=1 Tax=Aeromicrobium fastidiosum TaxID=52699 RepID=UPI0020232FCA|nr:bifunctional diguanylate cyclase/phosphodiesterase [Aeromicrobium fastidiosum]MCL8252035.1 bifunctional diguanylate cyclase/phosphodiesterase [Aeromicrobium fastidiosum]
MRSGWRVYAAASTTVAVVYLAMPSGTPADLLYLAVGLSSVAAIVLGAARNRPSTATPWLLLAAGQGAWVTGDVVYGGLAADGSTPYPSFADVPYLASYPLLAGGIVLLMRTQRRTRDLAGVVDTAIITVGFGLLSWSFIAGPLIEDRTTTQLGLVVAIAYPAADVVLLALVLRLMTGQHTWSPAFLLLVSATGTSVAADTMFAASAGSHAGSSAVIEAFWLGSYVLWGAAALHPDMVTLTRPAPRGPTPFTLGRLGVLATVVLLPAALLASRELVGVPVDPTTLVVASAVLALLAMGRMACDIDEIRATAHQRDSLRDDLFDRATTDPVTGVANRPFVLQQISAALERGVRDGTPSALVDVHLGGVARILEDMGFGHRDDTLHAVARRIEQVLAPDDVLARVGPEELVVLVERLTPSSDLAGLARDVVRAVDTPLLIGGRQVGVSAAVGISVSLDGSTDADDLLHQARLAARRARSSGSERIEFFDATLRQEEADRLDVETGLVEALATGGLEIHYQPVVGVRTEVVDGYEALVRWDRPGHGLLLPDTFIPVAERSDLVCELGRWVLHEATRQLVDWTRGDPIGAGDLTVAVNVSGRHLASGTIVDDVADALRASGLAPHRLTVEVTETVLVDEPRATLHMAALRSMGVSVGIDDFGTGYTSIARMRSLPADVVKIDRSLVASTEQGASELLALVVHAAHACGLLAVAEGVEERHQLDALRGLACDSAQGYLFSRPLAADLVPHRSGTPKELA